jgi:hypothetical protein
MKNPLPPLKDEASEDKTEWRNFLLYRIPMTSMNRAHAGRIYIRNSMARAFWRRPAPKTRKTAAAGNNCNLVL